MSANGTDHAAMKTDTATFPKGVFNIQKSENMVVWALNPKVYPMDVVYQTAFVFLDRAYMLLDQDKEKRILVRLKGKETLDNRKLEEIIGEFANELINQGVRKQLAKQNKTLRELIVSKALFASSRPDELGRINADLGDNKEPAQRPWDDATKEEQDELDQLLAEIEQDFKDDPMGIAVPWDEKYGSEGDASTDSENDEDKSGDDNG